MENRPISGLLAETCPQMPDTTSTTIVRWTHVQLQILAKALVPHEDILSLVNFYSTAWKSGRWPAITKDQVWVMARPHARYGASGGYGVPQGRDFVSLKSYGRNVRLTRQTQDNFYAQVHLTADASITLCAGACVTKAGVAGINRFSQPMTPGQGISVEIKRNGQVTTRLNPSFTFQGGADRTNFSMSHFSRLLFGTTADGKIT
jgi:glucan endo-1,3-alpha-glucosidase